MSPVSINQSKLQKPLLSHPITSIYISRELIDLSSVMVTYDIMSTSNSATDMNNWGLDNFNQIWHYHRWFQETEVIS